MDQENIFAKLKKDVRSLLISSKLGVEAEQLKRDYYSMLGQPLPLRQLGFSNVMEMVREMPDVVTVNFRNNGSIFFKAVGDETTRNIEELVSNQRTPKTKKIRKGAVSYSMPRHRDMTSHVVLPRRGHAPPAVPAQLRAQLRILLSQGPLRLSDLESCYLRFYGHPLRAHSYGFFSIGEMLEAAADLMVIQQYRLGSVVTLREQMVPRLQCTPKKTGPVKSTSSGSGGADSIGKNNRAETTRKPSVNESPQSQSPIETTSGCVQKESTTLGNKVDAKKGGNPELCKESQPFQNRVLQLEDELRQQILENGVAGTISQELKDKLREVVGQTRGGLSVHELPVEYKRLFGEDLPLLHSGFVSVTELVSAMSDTFNMKPAENDHGSHWIVTNIKECSDFTKSGSKKIHSVDNGVRKQLKSYSFSCGGSAWEYKLENDNDIKEAEINEGTINHSRPLKMLTENYPSIHVHGSPVLPLDALQSQRLKPPTRRGVQELVDVRVEHVESPGHFYICFTNSEEAHALNNMMFEMRRCYSCPEVSERYRLHERFFRRGQVCCVSPKGMWFYRVVIHQIISPTQVIVYFVDFGDMTVVPSANLMFLKSCYSVIPAQAVPSSLAGIKPTAGSWSTEGKESFKNLCSGCVLVGALDFYTGDVLRLYLCDTSTDKDIYIHTVLLSQGHGTAYSPAASAAAACIQVSPVRLYLGEGMVDLPELEEMTSVPNPTNLLEQSTLTSHEVEEEEMPALEIIEDNEVGSHIKGQDPNLSNDQTLRCTELGWALTNKPSPTNPHFSPLAPPDVIQTKTTSAHCQADFKTQTVTSPAAPSSDNSSICCLTKEKEQLQPKLTTQSLVKSSQLLSMLSLHTSDLGQGLPLHLRNAGITFPLFGAR